MSTKIQRNVTGSSSSTTQKLWLYSTIYLALYQLTLFNQQSVYLVHRTGQTFVIQTNRLRRKRNISKVGLCFKKIETKSDKIANMYYWDGENHSWKGYNTRYFIVLKTTPPESQQVPGLLLTIHRPMIRLRINRIYCLIVFRLIDQFIGRVWRTNHRLSESALINIELAKETSFLSSAAVDKHKSYERLVEPRSIIRAVICLNRWIDAQ